MSGDVSLYIGLKSYIQLSTGWWDAYPNTIFWEGETTKCLLNLYILIIKLFSCYVFVESTSLFFQYLCNYWISVWANNNKGGCLWRLLQLSFLHLSSSISTKNASDGFWWELNIDVFCTSKVELMPEFCTYQEALKALTQEMSHLISFVIRKAWLKRYERYLKQVSVLPVWNI